MLAICFVLFATILFRISWKFMTILVAEDNYCAIVYVVIIRPSIFHFAHTCMKTKRNIFATSLVIRTRVIWSGAILVIRGNNNTKGIHSHFVLMS